MKITNFRYLTPLRAFRGIEAIILPGGKKALFVVERDFRVEFVIDGVKHEITVPKGLLTDGTSVPRMFRSIVERFGEGVEASLVHDFLYAGKWKNYHKWNRKEADLILLAGLEAAGVSWWKRKAMYRVVRVGGANSFNNGINTYLENMEDLE